MAWPRRTCPAIYNACQTFVDTVDARRPTDTPFYCRRSRLPRCRGANMEQFVRISHIVIFTGVFQASAGDGTVRLKLS